MHLSIRKTALILMVTLGAFFWASQETIADDGYILTKANGQPVDFKDSEGFLLAAPAFVAE